MSEDVITITTDGPVGVVTLNRPETLNASDHALHHRLSTVWGDVRALEGLRAVVLTGAGDAFSAGGDFDLLQDMVDDPALRAAVMAEAATIVRSMVEFPLPIIAAINGPAVGLGSSLAGLCDLVVIEEDAYLADPHVALGLAAGDGAVLTWPALIGLQRTKELVLLGGRISAEEACRIGLANRIVPPGEALPQALEWAKKVAALPPQAVRETLAALDKPMLARLADDLPEVMDAESRSFDEPAFQSNLARMRERRRT